MIPDAPEDAQAYFQDPLSVFDSLVDPMMLLPDMGLGDFPPMDNPPPLPLNVPGCNAIGVDGTGGLHAGQPVGQPAIHDNGLLHGENGGPGSLYEKLTANPLAGIPPPTHLAYASPYLTTPMGAANSPSSLMMSTDSSWMHSTKPRRRRSTYASPTLGAMNLGTAHLAPYMSSPVMGMTGFGMPAMGLYPGSPQMHLSGPPSMMCPVPNMPLYYSTVAPSLPMMPMMSPLTRAVKFPMAPLASNTAVPSSGPTGGKIPLVLPCHLQQQMRDSSVSRDSPLARDNPLANSAAPNVLSVVTSGYATPLSQHGSRLSSLIASRCSSVAPDSSVSSSASHRWFTEMTATKNLFLTEAEAIDFSNVTVLELKQLLRKFGLNSAGKKVQLTERIREIAKYLRSESGQTKRARLDTVESTATELPVAGDSAVEQTQVVA